MDRLLLVRHAASPSTRRACFPRTTGTVPVEECEPLDARGAAAAAALRDVLTVADRCWSSYAERALQTARLAGLEPQPLAELAECDFGRWAGRTLPEVHDRDPEGLDRWFADPDTAAHGGEGLSDVRARAAKVLLRASRAPGTTVAITHGGFVKAALLEVLGLDADAIWQLDVAPASVTQLNPMLDGWRVVRLNWTRRMR